MTKFANSHSELYIELKLRDSKLHSNPTEPLPAADFIQHVKQPSAGYDSMMFRNHRQQVVHESCMATPPAASGELKLQTCMQPQPQAGLHERTKCVYRHHAHASYSTHRS